MAKTMSLSVHMGNRGCMPGMPRRRWWKGLAAAARNREERPRLKPECWAESSECDLQEPPLALLCAAVAGNFLVWHASYLVIVAIG